MNLQEEWLTDDEVLKCELPITVTSYNKLVKVKWCYVLCKRGKTRGKVIKRVRTLKEIILGEYTYFSW